MLELPTTGGSQVSASGVFALSLDFTSFTPVFDLKTNRRLYRRKRRVFYVSADRRNWAITTLQINSLLFRTRTIFIRYYDIFKTFVSPRSKFFRSMVDLRSENSTFISVRLRFLYLIIRQFYIFNCCHLLSKLRYV